MDDSRAWKASAAELAPEGCREGSPEGMRKGRLKQKVAARKAFSVVPST